MLEDLYQDIILDHGRRPRNKRALENPTHQATGFNQLCGDQITLELEIADGVIKDAGFSGYGCAISTASASMMTEQVRGRPIDELPVEIQRFIDCVTGKIEADIGDLNALTGVRQFPNRVKCATLAWHALDSAISGNQEAVTTE